MYTIDDEFIRDTLHFMASAYGKYTVKLSSMILFVRFKISHNRKTFK